MTAYAVWMTVLIVSYFALPGQRIVTWTALGLSGVVAIVAGVVINRPARMMPWLLLAAANLSFASGQLIFLAYGDVLHKHLPVPSAADVFYLATYPFYAGGLFMFIRWRTAGRDRRSLLDALTLTCGLALLSWVYLILPLVNHAGLTSLQKAFSIAYPLGDVLVIAMLVRLLAPGAGREQPDQHGDDQHVAQRVGDRERLLQRRQARMVHQGKDQVDPGQQGEAAGQGERIQQAPPVAASGAPPDEHEQPACVERIGGQVEDVRGGRNRQMLVQDIAVRQEDQLAAREAQIRGGQQQPGHHEGRAVDATARHDGDDPAEPERRPRDDPLAGQREVADDEHCHPDGIGRHHVSPPCQRNHPPGFREYLPSRARPGRLPDRSATSASGHVGT